MAVTFSNAKDPDEVLDYVIDWTARLASDTIATSTFSIVSAVSLTIDSESNTTTTSTVWLSSGTIGETAEILCRITTAGGRTMDQTVKLNVRKK